MTNDTNPYRIAFDIEEKFKESLKSSTDCFPS